MVIGLALAVATLGLVLAVAPGVATGGARDGSNGDLIMAAAPQHWGSGEWNWDPADPRAWVPKLVWQTYKSKDVPEQYAAARRRGMALNPDWTFLLVDDAEGAELIARHFPQLAGVFSRIVVGAGKADVIRLCLLYTYGGLYIDLDSEITVPLAELVRENDTALLAHEGGSVQFGKPGTNMSFSNYSCATFNEFRRDTKRPRTHILTVLQSAMFFGPRHPALRRIIAWVGNGLREPENMRCSTHSRLLVTTGPVAVTLALDALRRSDAESDRRSFATVRWDQNFGHPLAGSESWKATLRRGVNFGHKIKVKIEGYEDVHVGNSFGTGRPGAANVGVHSMGKNARIMDRLPDPLALPPQKLFD